MLKVIGFRLDEGDVGDFGGEDLLIISFDFGDCGKELTWSEYVREGDAGTLERVRVDSLGRGISLLVLDVGEVGKELTKAGKFCGSLSGSDNGIDKGLEQGFEWSAEMAFNIFECFLEITGFSNLFLFCNNACVGTCKDDASLFLV